MQKNLSRIDLRSLGRNPEEPVRRKNFAIEANLVRLDKVALVKTNAVYRFFMKNTVDYCFLGMTERKDPSTVLLKRKMMKKASFQ